MLTSIDSVLLSSVSSCETSRMAWPQKFLPQVSLPNTFFPHCCELDHSQKWFPKYKAVENSHPFRSLSFLGSQRKVGDDVRATFPASIQDCRISARKPKWSNTMTLYSNSIYFNYTCRKFFTSEAQYGLQLYSDRKQYRIFFQ